MGKGIDSNEYGGHKRTRFPCLATARYVVAAVVSVLTVAVVVMVTIVALRPEKVIFSIPHQYIVADRQWWDDFPDLRSEHAPAVQPPTTSAVKTNAAGTATSTKTAGPVINDPDDDVPLAVNYSPVKNVSFLVSFTADNPSGRADVTGQNVTVRVLDMPDYESPSFSFQTTRLTEIVKYELQGPFSVNRQTSHTDRKWIFVDNTDVLYYLAKTYGGSTSFPAMVQVNATIVPASAGLQGKNSSQIYYCWPVTVGRYTGYSDSTPCRPEKEMDFNVTYSGPPTAPAPAPSPAPIGG